jgi:biotin carboxylase
MRVIFIAPSYPAEMALFTRGLAEVGAEVLGVGDQPLQSMDPSVRHHLAGYLQVPRIMDEDDVFERVVAWARDKNVDRVLTCWEPTVLLAARVREALGVMGMTHDVALGFRDKQLMKERLAAAGVRVPRSVRATTAEQMRKAAEKIDFPLIVKPIAGAGSADTYAVRNDEELEKVIKAVAKVSEVSVEEYIEGEEFTYDTVCVEGEPIYENVAQYLPKPLEARSHEWISPVIITVRDLQSEKMKRGIALGRQVLKALKMHDGFTHMEWFYTPKGEAVFGEIGCRPGGARLVDQMNYTSDIDLFREWARACCWHAFDADTTRKYNCAIIFKRAKGQGTIKAITGLEHFKHACGPAFVIDNLLRPGQQRRNWLHTLVSDGYVIIRHPDWETTRRLAFKAATDVTLYAS